MTPTVEKISHKAGLPPGALVHISKKKDLGKVKVRCIKYSKEELLEESFLDQYGCYPKADMVNWINVDGLHNTGLIKEIGDEHNLHPLILEDILNTFHRPKFEEMDDNIFVTVKMLGVNKKGNKVISEQVSFVLHDEVLLSFQEAEGDLFDPIRARLKENVGLLRKKGTDYLLYRLLDVIVDNYFHVVEHISSKTEALEDTALNSPTSETLNDIQKMKRELITMRKAVNPLRETLSSLEKSESPIIKEETLRYFRDVYEHIIHVQDSLESQRDLLASVMDLYLSGVSNRMNEVMKVLTIIATIFIPLTFIAGVYGMNFEYIPELKWKYSYFVFWILMVGIFVGLLFYFRRKKWL